MATSQEGSEWDHWMARGQNLGITDKNELLEFVRGQQNAARDERAAERAAKKEEQLQKIELEKQKVELQRLKLEQEKESTKQSEVDKLIEIEKLKSEQEIARLKAESAKDIQELRNEGLHGKIVSKVRLAVFDERTDDIDSYLFRFEKHASGCGWDKGHWGFALGSYLAGRALDIYKDLSLRKQENYEELKQGLLRHFQCTEDGFRLKFRSLRIEPNETFMSYVDRLRHYFDRWVELANMEKDFKALENLLMREQIFETCSKDIVSFLKESWCTDVEDIVEKAERFREAHPGKSFAKKSGSNELWSANLGVVASQNNPGQNRTAGRGSSRFNQNTSGNSNAGRPPYRKNQCRICHGFGHWGNECPEKNPKATDSQVLGAQVQTQVHGKKQKATNNDPQTKAGLCIPIGKCHECGQTYSVVKPCGHSLEQVSATLSDSKSALVTCEGTLSGKKVSVLLDSGCTTVGVRKSLVRSDQLTGEIRHCIAFGGELLSYPVARIYIESPYFVGQVDACVLENPIADVILGRIPGASYSLVHSKPIEVVAAVQTRAQKVNEKKPVKPLLVASVPALDIGPNELRNKQKEDETLQSLFKKVESGHVKCMTNGRASFEIKNGILMRTYVADTGETSTQVVVPKSLRNSLLITAHEGLLAGHMGIGSTRKRLEMDFFWPGMYSDVAKFCQSCDQCQKTFPKGKVKPAPLQVMPQIEVPFERIGIDLIGPINPMSERKHRYILTVVDFATRYPEAIPLQNIDSQTVAEALVTIFSRVGLPRQILSDQGTQFTSELMKEVMRLLSISQAHSSIYHAQSNGLVERMNGTLKSMLKKMTQEKPKDWDRYVVPLLFAYREIPQSSTGFSPFQLLFGRTPRGPLHLIRDMWIDKDVNNSTVDEYTYVCELRDRLTQTCKLAQANAKQASQHYKLIHDKKAQIRTLEVGDKVLVLLPTHQNKLMLKWQGPFEVVKKLQNCDYVVNTNHGEKVYHINMLKKYVERTLKSNGQNSLNSDDTFPLVAIAIVSEEKHEKDAEIEQVKIHTLTVNGTETYKDIVYDKKLSKLQKSDLQQVFLDLKFMLTSDPGLAKWICHNIRVTTDIPVQIRQYPVPFHLGPVIEKEVQNMLRLGVIEPSDSPYASPFVLVTKKDTSVRFCIDFRALNKITVQDAEPIPDVEELFAKLKGFQYFTKIDLAKGYWQIPLAEGDKAKTAFRTAQGLFQFTRMPFGLVTAPSTFARLMRQLHLDSLNAVSYFDDIVVGSEDWASHPVKVRALLEKLNAHGLTARPSKIEAGCQELQFLGHVISKDHIKPVPEKVNKMIRLDIPRTKKQVRAVLGLIGYYRRYVPNFASIVAPLTELIKKKQPVKPKWSQPCQDSLEKVQNILNSEPVLLLPDFSAPFTLRTDASNTGLGAVLIQEDSEGCFHPVAYASRKLLDRESRYSVVERECLAIVWGIDKFLRYLFGRPFNLETDHRPLSYLKQSKLKNSRLMRWALALQEYQFHVVPISGVSNIEADVLSRCAL